MIVARTKVELVFVMCIADPFQWIVDRVSMVAEECLNVLYCTCIYLITRNTREKKLRTDFGLKPLLSENKKISRGFGLNDVEATY